MTQALADVTTIDIPQERAIRHAETATEPPRTARTTDEVTEQVKNAIKQHCALTMDSAFDRLRRYARARNLRLTQVARDIVEGRLDPTALTSPLMRNYLCVTTQHRHQADRRLRGEIRVIRASPART